jgi:hypothetical protein
VAGAGVVDGHADRCRCGRVGDRHHREAGLEVDFDTREREAPKDLPLSPKD